MKTCCPFLLIVSILVLMPIDSRRKDPTYSYLLLLRAGPCVAASNHTIAVSEFRISHESKTENYTVTGILDIKSDIDNGWNVKVTVERCFDVRNTDTCDHFRTSSILTNGCNSKSNIFNLLAQHSEPRLSCPIRAGKYKISRLPYSAKDYFKASQSSSTVSLFGYNVNLAAHTGATVHGCMNVLMRLWYAREHDWTAARAQAQKDEPEGAIVPDIEDN